MSKNNTHMNDDLLVKYLVGEATLAEKKVVQRWLKSGELNRAYYEQLKTIWEQSLLVADKEEVDEDAAYNRLQNRIKHGPPAPEFAPEEEPAEPVRSRTNWLAVAATLLIICAAGYFGVDYYQKQADKTLVKVNSHNSVLVDTLPDKSVVTLNRLSQLSYMPGFKGDTRVINLLGEAFFKVTPDKNKPFIIKVNDVTVKVVGTSFNVKSRDGVTEVVVETGIVNVKGGGKEVNIKPGEKAELDSRRKSFKKYSIRSNLYSYYVTHELVCDQTPLRELVPALNEAYAVNIVLDNPAVGDLPITTVFKNKTIDQILLVIGDTFNLTVTYKDNAIILK